MWLPLYDTISDFLYLIHGEPSNDPADNQGVGFEWLMPYYVSTVYVLFWLIVIKFVVKYWKNNKEN